MLKSEMEKQRTLVAKELGVDWKAMRNHPYDLEIGDNGTLLVRWHDQAPDGIIREGKPGSYTTLIRPANATAPEEFIEDDARRSQSG